MRRYIMVAAVAGGVFAGLTPTSGISLKQGMKITEDARIDPGVYRLGDPAGTGAVLIEGNGITVDFQGAELVGSRPDQEPDAFTGKGIVITGKKVTLRNAKVRGYKVGIYAHDCEELVLEDLDISGNYQQHLRSTPEAESGGDWLFPHNNDRQKWMDQYGAGMCVESSSKCVIRRVRARDGQNGIILDRVNDSKIYDNDCSFLSGWGLATWRSNRNVITRNAFDFCVRGYSHGVYNRGQDSAGILMFEQNNENVIAENSATHGGDGFFGFAGHEALGQNPPPSEDFDYKRKGNTDNLLIGNDFSYAPAHGIEMTFSFGNRMLDNRVVGNAICGVWGGYSQESLIAGNRFEDNGEMGYGLERGGVNIEHSRKNRIIDNKFIDNKCGVHLWWDPDEGLTSTPWAKANGTACDDNVIANNLFEGNPVAIHLRKAEGTIIAGNTFEDFDKAIRAEDSDPILKEDYEASWEKPDYPVFGETRPVGARKHLRGRDKIVMTPWGPYDHEEVLVLPTQVSGDKHASVQILGPSGSYEVTKVDGEVTVEPRRGKLPGRIQIKADAPGFTAFELAVKAGDETFDVSGTLLSTKWDVRFYKWNPENDPREDAQAWKKLIAGDPVEKKELESIDFTWGGGAPNAKVGPDHFGTVAETTLKLPAGKYRIWTISDDGIRVWVDDQKVIDDWTWHPPKENVGEVSLKAGEHHIRVEHFEINGLAQLQVRIEPME